MFRKKFERRGSSAAEGHTLMELLIVLVLIAGVASLVAPVTVRAYSQFKLRSTAGSMTKLFQQAKSRAVLEGRTYLVIFPQPTGNGRELLLVRDDGKYVNQLATPFDILLAGRRGKGDWTVDIDSLAFFPDGTSEALELVLKNSSNRPLRLEVDPMTARARMVEISTDEE